MTDDSAGRPRKVTIRDVARASGTSISTVSVALSGGPGVSDETRERVIEWANRLGWRPDRRASALRRQNPRIVGMVYEVEQGFQSSLVDAVYAAADERNLNVSLAGATVHHSEYRSASELLRDRAQAVVLTGSELTEDELGRLAKHLPVLSLGRWVEVPGVDVVVSDAEMGYRQAVDHLVDLGHRDIAHVDGSETSRLSARRVDAYKAAMAHHGLENQVRVVPGGNSLVAGVEAARYILEMEPFPTAIVCYNDLLAVSIMRTLRDQGVRVPEEVSIVGYDDDPGAQDPTTNLTTVAQNATLMADAAMEVCDLRVTAEAVVSPGDERMIVLPTELKVRATTGPVR